MGISFDRAARIAGYRPSTFKNALRGYLRTENPGSFIDLKSIFPHRRDGAIVYEECLDRGLIDPITGAVTPKGMIVAKSKVAARAPWSKAKAVLDDFLANVDRLNTDETALSNVDQVWLFGSFLRSEPTVGDIDLAVTRFERAGFKDLNARVRHAKALIADYPEAPRSWLFPWNRIDWLYRRAIFGRRRHPLLAGVIDGIDDLVPLGVPCKLIYDRSRGGRVDDPVLPRHPESSGRSNTIDPLPELPNLTPTELRPMDARWVAGFQPWGAVSPCAIFRGWTDVCKRLFPRYPQHLRVIVDGAGLDDLPWVPKALKGKALDGRSAMAILSVAERWGVSVTLRREIECAPERAVLKVSFTDVTFRRSRTRIHAIEVFDMAAAVALITAVDAERIIRRQLESNTPPAVTIRVCGGELSEELGPYFVEQIVDLLTHRVVAIEPSGVPEVVIVEMT